MIALEGSISGEHGIGFSKAPFLPLELSADEIALMRRVKQAFDPNGILNPGKIFPHSFPSAGGCRMSTGSARSGRMEDCMLDDVRYAGRLFRRTPGFTAGAVLTIALAVGSNVAVFSALYGALLRPLPVADGDRLVVSYLVDRELRQDTRAVSHVVFDAWRAQARTLTSMAAVAPYRFDLIGDGAARRVEAGVVSGAFFETLGVAPALGRTFTEASARESGEPACVISDSLWQARFGGDAGVLGRRIGAGGLSFVIVGVMPRSFDRWRGLAEMWVPVDGVPHFSAVKTKPGYYSYHVIGRLQDGVTPAAAAAELTSLSAPIETDGRPDDASRHGVNVRLLREDVIGQTPQRMLLSLAVVVALVWVIAVVNIASLLLARNVERSREFAVRSAIGGTRWHVLRQLLVESVLLASTGAAAGLVIARWVVDLLRTYGPPALAREGLVSVDMTSAGLAALGALMTTVVIGVLPAIGPLRLPAHAVLLKSNPATSSSWLQDSFVGLQVAFTTLVVIGTISVGQAFWMLKRVDMGYDAGAVMTMRVSFPTRYFDENQPKLRQALQQLEQHAAAVPGVRHVALGDVPVPYPYAPWSFTIERGRRFLNGNPKDRPLAPGVHFVSSDYQRTLGIRLLSGRELLPDDIAEGRPVAVISRTMAHLHWQDQDPIGRRITFGKVGRDGVSTEPWFTIVGVVADVRYGNPEAAIGPQCTCRCRSRRAARSACWRAPAATQWPRPRRCSRRSSPSIPTSRCTTLAHSPTAWPRRRPRAAIGQACWSSSADWHCCSPRPDFTEQRRTRRETPARARAPHRHRRDAARAGQAGAAADAHGRRDRERGGGDRGAAGGAVGGEPGLGSD